jgi:hypothetical protein
LISVGRITFPHTRTGSSIGFVLLIAHRSITLLLNCY